jgi:hypothetical protein
MLMLLLLFMEYYEVVLMVFKIKTNKFYIKFIIPKPNISDMDLISIWFTLCKINAFKKVYYMYTKKKKINLISLILFLIIYLFSIPLRLLKLAYYFIKSKESFRTSLIFLTLDSYDLIANLKIEVLNGSVYLNCNNLYQLSKSLVKNNKSLDKKTFCEGMQNLQNVSRSFSEKEKSFGRSEVDLSLIFDSQGNLKSNIPHYTIVKNATSLHSTSNTKRIFDKDQIVDGVIPTLSKPNAIAPGTIITKDISDVKKITNKSI